MSPHYQNETGENNVTRVSQKKLITSDVTTPFPEQVQMLNDCTHPSLQALPFPILFQFGG